MVNEDDSDIEDVETGEPYFPPEVEEGNGMLKPIPNQTCFERIFSLIALAALGTSLASIITIRTYIAIIAGILSIGIGSYSYHQQCELTEIAALKETQIALQAEVNRFKDSNERLGSNIDKMGDIVGNLGEVKDALDEITKMQGVSVEQFAQQVARNKKILGDMQNQVRNVVTQNLIAVLERTDKDGDNIIDEEEVNDVLKSLSSVEHIKVREDMFRKNFTGKSNDVLLKLLADVAQEDIPEPERIFVFESDDKQEGKEDKPDLESQQG